MDRRSYYYNKRPRYARSGSGSPARKSRGRRRVSWKFILIVVLVLAVVGVGIWLLTTYVFKGVPKASPKPSVTATAIPTPTATPTIAPSPTPTANTGGLGGFTAAASADSDPTKLKFDATPLQVDYQSADTFTRETAINLPAGKDYTLLTGITTFRGNNYRDSASYGTATVTEGKFVPTPVWTASVGKLDTNAGVGWTGQPLIVQWTEDQKKLMNLNAAAKSATDLKEVIVAAMDGKVYFLNLADGTATRTVIDTKVPNMGTPSLDPRGYPLLYVGQGSNMVAGKTVDVNYRAVNLNDGTITNLLSKANADTFSYRKHWVGFGASPLVDAASDTIIEPGENGVLYTLHLNSQSDAATGKTTVAVDHRAKYRYTTPDYGVDKPWGIYSSPVVYHNYIYFTDNGGYLQCVDLNTLQLVWVVHVGGIANSTPVLEESTADGTAYLYTAAEVDPNDQAAKSAGKAKCAISKINAKDGTVVWTTTGYDCYAGIETARGGIVASPVLGKNDISNAVIFTISRTGSNAGGLTVALDKATGSEIWKANIEGFSNSSPVDVNTADGKSYIVQCNNKGTLFLLDGKTGEVKDKIALNSSVDASPVVFNDMIVIGTKSSQKIYGIKIK